MRQRHLSSHGSAGSDEAANSATFLAPQQRQHTQMGVSDFALRPNASLSVPENGTDEPPHAIPPVSSSSSSDTESTSSSSSSSSSTSTSAAGSQLRSPNAPTAEGSAGAAAAAADATTKSTSTRAKHWIKKRLIPQFMSEYGKTVYGGAPLAQQTLPGIFNYPSPFLLVPFFFLFTIPFVVVGAVMLVEGPKHAAFEQEYSHIHQYQYLPTDPLVNVNQGLVQFTADGVVHAQGTRTWLQMDITRRLKGPVYLYYKLDNFYQNHRDFHDGRSNPQLTGKQNLGDTYTCKPYTNPGFREGESDTPISFTDASGTVVTTTLAYFTYSPCGLAAWSKFNDTFVFYREMTPAEADAATAAGATVVRGGDDGTRPLELICNGTDFGLRGEPLGGSVAANRCDKKGISWKADTDVRFHNMTLRQDWWSLYYPYATTNEYLRNGWYLHEPGHALPDQSDYDLQVWMRSSFTSSFRKLYRVITVDLEPGTYWVDITEFYDVVSFRGRKSIVLHNGHWTGGRNVELGVIFLVMGCLSFVFGVAFTVECLLQRNGVNRYEHLQEPKRSWYLFPPDDPQFAHYYQLRLRRHIPMAQLQALRKTVEELEGRLRGSQDGSLTLQQEDSSSDSAGSQRDGAAAH